MKIKSTNINSIDFNEYIYSEELGSTNNIIAQGISENIEAIVVLKLVRNLKLLTGSDNLCLSGGVALNCVANGCILDKEYFDNVWIQPASGDSGSSIGAALAYIYDELKVNRKINSSDLMSSAYLGPEYNNKDIEKYLKENKFPYKKFS